MKLVIRALLPALLLGIVAGCGSDEPALQDLSDAERTTQQAQQKDHMMKQRKGGSIEGQQGKDYRESTTGGS